MRTLYLLSVYLHILFATIWIGSLVFLGVGIVPILRSPEYRHLAPRLLYRVGVRLRYLNYFSLTGLLVTGFINLYYRGIPPSLLFSQGFLLTSYGNLVFSKISLVLLIIALTLYHDIKLGPQATRLLEENPDSPQAQRARKQSSWLGRIVFILSLFVLYFAIRLVRG